ncbi:MAG: glycosyltransferase family 2 protein [Bacteroidales bacterium]|nr:glycosyltransferase family 2 protein [Bacteroidales bacterium]
MTDLSIIIPVYNGEKLLRRCLDSVVGQQTSRTWEVWLVDDGSTDASLAIAREYAARSVDGRCFNVVQQENAGPARARNRGIEAAQGRYVAFLDADDYWQPTYIERTVDFLDAHPECVAVSVVCKNVAVSGVSYTPACLAPDSEENSPFFTKSEKKISSLRVKTAGTSFVIDNFYAYWARECHVGTCSTTMSSAAAKKVLMREDLRISEDYEFWLLLAAHGRWGMIPEALYVSDGTSTLATRADWLGRMKRRWENAPTLSEWERRIVEQRPELAADDDFLRAEGRVARNLTYCQLLSGRESLARKEALAYGRWFIADPIGRLMNLCKWNCVTWWLMCRFLRYREYHRFK